MKAVLSPFSEKTDLRCGLMYHDIVSWSSKNLTIDDLTVECWDNLRARDVD